MVEREGGYLKLRDRDGIRHLVRVQAVSHVRDLDETHTETAVLVSGNGGHPIVVDETFEDVADAVLGSTGR